MCGLPSSRCCHPSRRIPRGPALVEDRAVLGGIIYVLRGGVPWRLLPAGELGCGSGVTCWRRLRDWQAGRGVGGSAPSAAGLAGRRRPGRLVPGGDRLRQCPGPAWGELTGANPVDRAKPGSKSKLAVKRLGRHAYVGADRNGQYVRLLPTITPVGPMPRLVVEE